MTDHHPSKPGKAGPDRRTILQTIGAAGIATATNWPTQSKADMTPTQTTVSPGFASGWQIRSFETCLMKSHSVNSTAAEPNARNENG